MNRNNLLCFLNREMHTFESWKISGVFYLVKQELWRLNAMFLLLLLLEKKRYLVKSSTFEIPFFKLGNRKHHCICKLSWKDCMARAELKKTKEENLRKAMLRPNQITIGGHQCHSKTTCTTQAHFCMFLFLQLLFSRFQISSSVFFPENFRV